MKPPILSFGRSAKPVVLAGLVARGFDIRFLAKLANGNLSPLFAQFMRDQLASLVSGLTDVLKTKASSCRNGLKLPITWWFKKTIGDLNAAMFVDRFPSTIELRKGIV